MKKSLKIFLLALALTVMTGCSAQRRASRMVRRAVNLCPEMVQLTAHPIDTVLTAPAFTDMATLPLPKAFTGDTIYAATDHGTFVVSLSQSDSSLRVGFVAAPQRVRYQDTVRYSQVTINGGKPAGSGSGFWNGFACWLAGFGLAFALCFWVLCKIFKNNFLTKKR